LDSTSEQRQNKILGIAKAKSLVLYEYYKRNPIEWLRKCVKTVDEHDTRTPVKTYPMRPYIPQLVYLFFEEDILLLPKSRQMTITWLIIALCLHELMFTPHRLTFVMSKKEDDAFKLIDRMRFIYTHLPMFLQNLCPLERLLRDQPMGNIIFKNGSIGRGLPQGPDQVRSYTVSRLFCDESAFQDRFEEVYTAAQPSLMGGGKFIGVSSVNPGYMQALCEKT